MKNGLLGEVDPRVRPLDRAARRVSAVFEDENRLDEGRDAGRRVEVSDVAS